MTHRNDRLRLTLLDRVLHAAAFVPHTLPPATRPDVAGDGPVKLMLPEASGLDVTFTAQFRRIVLSLHRNGRQIAVHAATRAGFALALDAIDDALGRVPRPDHRHRIEHGSIAPPSLIERAAELGVVVVGNPNFLYESGGRYRAMVPAADLPHLYPVGALARCGVITAAASDTPVTPSSPLHSIHAAITREGVDGVTIPGEPAGLDDALAMVTRSAAFAAFAGDRAGIIAPGRPANLVLLDREPGRTALPLVLWTVIDGRPAFVADRAPSFPMFGA
jgi:predicted amidohydrolase YtcJ